MEIHEGNTIALKYLDRWKSEVLAHNETKEIARRRMDQIQHLLLENSQLSHELDQARDILSDALGNKLSTG